MQLKQEMHQEAKAPKTRGFRDVQSRVVDFRGASWQKPHWRHPGWSALARRSPKHEFTASAIRVHVLLRPGMRWRVLRVFVLWGRPFALSVPSTISRDGRAALAHSVATSSICNSVS